MPPINKTIKLINVINIDGTIGKRRLNKVVIIHIAKTTTNTTFILRYCDWRILYASFKSMARFLPTSALSMLCFFCSSLWFFQLSD